MEWINHYHRCHILLEVDPRVLLQKADNTNERWGFPKPEKLLPLLRQLQQGEPLDAPIVARSGRGIGFTDGRHRALAAVKLGLPTIKIAVLPEEIEFIQSFLHKGDPEGAPYTIFYSDGVVEERETTEEVVTSLVGRLFEGAIPCASR